MTAPEAPRDTFLGQPRSLATIFGVEMWERFSFYGMQGILLLYLYYSAAQGGLDIPQTTAAGIIGAYGGGVYLSTILGAWIADRLIGSERTLFYSAVLIMLGHLSLSLHHHRFIEHGQGAHPQAHFPIQGLVHHQFFHGFGMAGRAYDFVEMAFVVLVGAGLH